MPYKRKYFFHLKIKVYVNNNNIQRRKKFNNTLKSFVIKIYREFFACTYYN